MLRKLTVRNFAVIEEAELEFSAGLNVVTGETGAGKSILVEALGFLVGGRGSSSWLRAGAQRLEVAGWFDPEDFSKELRSQFKIGDGPVMVRRELDATGRSRAFLNASAVPLAVLAEAGESLVDFHGQHEHQTLLRPNVQLDLLDRFGGHAEEAEETAAAFSAWSALKGELESARMSDEERSRRADFARFQVDELSSAQLRLGEEEELEAALPLLKNSERLRTLAAGAYEILYEQEGSVLGALLKAERALAEVSKIDPGMGGAHDRLEEARLALEEVSHAVGEYRDKNEADPGKLDAVLARLETLSRLKRKYGATVADMLANRDRLAADLKRLENSERRREELEGELAAAEKRLSAACNRLHDSRVKAARRLEAALLKELKPLGLPEARFSVGLEMEEGRFARSGSDAAEFLLAPNPGEPLKAVKAIASGGELSRVMLALKTVLARADRVPVLVFDEVDAGIGGAVARAVGEKLAALGKARQVLCVTHLAQVACFSAAHFHATKSVSQGRTRTKVESQRGDGRLETLALMLGGRQATPASRRHASELLAESALP